MANYLDKTGLSYLWSKLKEKVNTMTAEPYKSGVNCVAGKYYTFNNKLYLCIKNTDGSIAITNTTYFTSTTVANELSSMSEKITNIGNARIKKQQRIYANDKGIATIPTVTGYIPVAVLGSDNTGIHSNSDGTYETRFLYADNSGNITINANIRGIVDVIYEKF